MLIYTGNTVDLVNRDSSVRIAIRYGLDGPDLQSRCGRDSPLPSILALEPT